MKRKVNFRELYTRSLPKIEPYLFLLPFLVTFFIFFLWPILFNLGMTFTDWHGARGGNYIGIKNYVELVKSTMFRKAALNTLWYAVVGGGVLLPLGFAVAYLLNGSITVGKKFFRTLFFLPVAAPPVLMALVFVIIYDWHYGILNYLLSIVGGAPQNWLGDVAFTKLSVIVVFIWRLLGLVMIYYLVGLQGLDVNMIEAAKVDGANGRQTILYIILPSLKPVILFISVVVTIEVFQIFQEPHTLFSFVFMGASGGPEDSALSMMQYIHRIGFSYQELGKAATAVVFLFSVVIVITILQLKHFGFFRRS
ncbi:L-arabinose transport system permease protein AraP [subsurface metagenome]